jgi:hypothetical protein
LRHRATNKPCTTQQTYLLHALTLSNPKYFYSAAIAALVLVIIPNLCFKLCVLVPKR